MMSFWASGILILSTTLKNKILNSFRISLDPLNKHFSFLFGIILVSVSSSKLSSVQIDDKFAEAYKSFKFNH